MRSFALQLPIYQGMSVFMKEIADEKNTQTGGVVVFYQKDDICLSTVENRAAGDHTIPTSLQKGIIHFYFCLEGEAVFAFGPHYSREIRRNFNYFFYNPEKDLPLALTLRASTQLVYLSISIHSLHDLFVGEPNGLPILNRANTGQKFYDEREIPPSIRVALNSIGAVPLQDGAARLFHQGKVFEILSLYFSSRIPDAASCPFLKDQEVVRKISVAKSHLLAHLDNPPGIPELAKICGLNEYQLKVGFKEVYGNTVHGFLLDHRLDHARTLLDTGHLQVNEVAFKVGYSNTSHFIAAFRKKFGLTPKKYLLSRNKS